MLIGAGVDEKTTKKIVRDEIRKQQNDDFFKQVQSLEKYLTKNNKTQRYV